MEINIAIDGPSAAGKSTLSRLLAEKLKYVHLDSGAMYRCVAYKANQLKLNLEDEAAIMCMLENTKIELLNNGAILLDGVEVNRELRNNELSMDASKVSMLKLVRADLVARQQAMALNKGVIMDGRDIGTVVLPDAEVKIYQTATSIARAERRYKENLEKGMQCELQSILAEIVARDYQDMNRLNSPLKKADDAIEIDTSEMSIEEVVRVIEEIVAKKKQLI